jgi:cyclic-di-GMP-binding protein
LPQAGSRSNIARGAARSSIWKLAWERAAPRGTVLNTTTPAASNNDQAKGARLAVMAAGGADCGYRLAGRIYDPQTSSSSRTSPMADTYSFDVVSDFDRQELVNTIDQVRRDVGTRYDLKDSATEIDVEEASLTITTASDMTLQAVEDVLRQKATKRNLSLKIFDFQTPEPVGGNRVKQLVKLRKGLSSELAKQLSKTVRDELKKVTVSIQGDSLRITGKNKDDLQQAINLLKAQDVEVPLQFENYR